jgi:hypothetical protein
MKPMPRFSMAVVTVGISFLMFSGQTRNDVVAAQGGKPVMMYRFYTGKDGLSRVEKIEVINFDPNNAANLMETTTGATLRSSKPYAPGADFGAFHQDRAGNIFSILPAMGRLNFRPGRESL